MRAKLKAIEGQKLGFHAQVGRFGTRYNPRLQRKEQTILLKNIYLDETDEFITDHVWMLVGSRIRKLGLQSGDVITFKARARKYQKNYYGKLVEDYKLHHHHAFEKIN